jgi:hypothetical protein
LRHHYQCNSSTEMFKPRIEDQCLERFIRIDIRRRYPESRRSKLKFIQSRLTCR